MPLVAALFFVETSGQSSFPAFHEMWKAGLPIIFSFAPLISADTNHLGSKTIPTFVSEGPRCAKSKPNALSMETN